MPVEPVKEESGDDRRPRRHPNSSFRAIGDEGGLVVLPLKREVKVLNPVGVSIFALIDGSRTVDQIIRQICDEYEISEDVARRDVHEFLEELGQHGMLADPEAPGSPGGTMQEAVS